ncbi:MAG: hypothetical protein AAF657_14015 [Acidobacteriota bacterium]
MSEDDTRAEQTAAILADRRPVQLSLADVERFWRWLDDAPQHIAVSRARGRHWTP